MLPDTARALDRTYPLQSIKSESESGGGDFVAMTSFDATTRRFALTIGSMAVLILLVTVVIVVYALTRMAGEVNRIENTVTEKSAVAAVQSDLRRLGETHNDYAEWDDAVRVLYGSMDAGWIVDNIVSSSLFDTVYIVDEDGGGCLAIRAASRSPSRYRKRSGRRWLR